jgi:pimeloyl-ACP methyl ester carboxylesterase
LIGMQTLTVNGYDIAYLDVGRGTDNSPPLVLVHGTLGDFRTWNAVLGPLSKKHRVVTLSLRRFFPEHWDGVGNDYLMAQHVADVVGFIEKLNAGPVDLLGHSRGGHIGFRVAQARPDLLRRAILAEPGGDLEPALQPARCRWGRAFRSRPRWCETATSTVRWPCSSTGSTAKARGRGGLRRRGSNCATTSIRCSVRSVRTASRF